MTADLSALIARLEAAEVGSRELGHEVLLALGWRRSVIGHFYGPLYQWSSPDFSPHLISGDEDKLPNPVLSIDAALALAERVLPDREIALSQRKPRHLETCAEWWHASLFKVRTGVVFGVGPSTVTAKASTPALALVIAVLRAKQGEGE